jgi:hypothetical protein
VPKVNTAFRTGLTSIETLWHGLKPRGTSRSRRKSCVILYGRLEALQTVREFVYSVDVADEDVRGTLKDFFEQFDIESEDLNEYEYISKPVERLNKCSKHNNQQL